MLIARRLALSLRTAATTCGGVDSFLYIPGNLAHKIVSVLKPAVDFDVTSDEDIERIRRSIEARGMDAVDFPTLRSNWNLLKCARVEVAKAKDEATSAATKLEEVKLKRERLKEVTKERNALEEATIPVLLRLPNVLHDRTPLADPKVVATSGEIPRFGFVPRSHQELGQLSKTLVLRHDAFNSFYLLGDLAWLDWSVTNSVKSRFTADGFLLTSNPNFCKPIVVEGCGVAFDDPSVTLHMERAKDANRLASVDSHLVGSATLMAFCGMLAKTSTKEEDLPVKYCASGRIYVPPRPSSGDDGLFGVTQLQALSVFVVCADDESALLEYDRCLDNLRALLVELDLHFRVVVVPATQLARGESLRTEVQMWSSSRRQYVTVSSMSLCGDFVSRRLLMCSRRGKDVTGYLRVVHGTALNVPHFVACLVENTQSESGEFRVPRKLSGSTK